MISIMFKLQSIRNQGWIKRIGGWRIWKEHSKAEWFILIVGVITLFYILINLFTSLGNQTPMPVTTAAVSLNDPGTFEIALASAINSTIEQGSAPHILINGSQFLPDVLQEISNAKSSILITDFIWDNGEFGKALFLALIEKAKQGVAVRILLDGIGGHGASKEYIKELTAAGGKVAYFRPVAWWNITRIDKRTHVRDFVFDGKTAYIGGIAVSDAWLGDATSSTSWHDFMFKMQGKMAERAVEMFSTLWSETTGEILVTTPLASQEKQVPQKPIPAETDHFISLLSAPAPDMAENMEHFLWLSINSGEHYIHIENPYIVPSRSILNALESKARQGVDVELIVPGKNTDAQKVRWASESYYTELLKSGVRIFEYQPSRIHAKAINIDGLWSVIGSANLDNRSSEINVEAIYGIEDAAFAHDLESKFQEDIQKSKEITAKEWKGNFILFRPFELLSRSLIKQY